MRESRTKLWISLGASVLTGAPLAGAAVPPSSGAVLPGAAAPAMLWPLGVQVATGPNEGGGGVLDATLALQLELQMMRAYVNMGVELLKAGDRGAAQAHFGPPLAVMYPAYKETLENRAVPFEAELRRLNTLANNQGTPLAEIEAAAAAVAERLEAAANTYGSWSTRLVARRVEVARMLVAAALNDWLEVGRVDDPAHQKGRGYVLVARELVAGVMAELRTRTPPRRRTPRQGSPRCWPSCRPWLARRRVRWPMCSRPPRGSSSPSATSSRSRPDTAAGKLNCIRSKP